MSCQAWLERRRLREGRLKAAALRQLASEAELGLGLSEEGEGGGGRGGGGGGTNIVVNPRDSHEQTKPARSSIVTFQIPHSDSDQKQKKERWVLFLQEGAHTDSVFYSAEL